MPHPQAHMIPPAGQDGRLVVGEGVKVTSVSMRELFYHLHHQRVLQAKLLPYWAIVGGVRQVPTSTLSLNLIQDGSPQLCDKETHKFYKQTFPKIEHL